MRVLLMVLGVGLPLIKPFLLFNYVLASDRSNLFWVYSFQAFVVPLLSLGIFDHSARVYSRYPNYWRSRFGAGRVLASSLAFVLSGLCGAVISFYLNFGLVEAVVSSVWLFAGCVFLGSLKRLRVQSASLFFGALTLKSVIEFVAYVFAVYVQKSMGLKYWYILFLECFAFFVCLAFLQGFVFKKISFEFRLSYLSYLSFVRRHLKSSFVLGVGLISASFGYQVDKIILIKVLDSGNFDLYVFCSLFKNIGVSAGAVWGVFMYPRVAEYMRSSYEECCRRLDKIIFLFWLSSPVLVVAGGVVISVYCNFFSISVTPTASAVAAVATMAVMSLNVVPEIYLVTAGRYGSILKCSLAYVVVQIVVIAFLNFLGVGDYVVYLWAGSGTLFLMHLLLIVQYLHARPPAVPLGRLSGEM